MTDNNEMDLGHEAFFSFPPAEDVIGVFAGIVAPSRRQGDEIYCQFNFSLNGHEVKTTQQDNGTLLLKPDELEILVARYVEMVDLVSKLFQHNFVIEKLSLICGSDQAGAIMVFLTPAGRRFTTAHQFPYAGENIIPKDFLHELKMLPSRHRGLP